MWAGTNVVEPEDNRSMEGWERQGQASEALPSNSTTTYFVTHDTRTEDGPEEFGGKWILNCDKVKRDAAGWTNLDIVW